MADGRLLTRIGAAASRAGAKSTGRGTGWALCRLQRMGCTGRLGAVRLVLPLGTAKG